MILISESANAAQKPPADQFDEQTATRGFREIGPATSPYDYRLRGGGPLWLAEMTPGSDMAQVYKRLERAKIAGRRDLYGITVYETFLFDTVDQRQRLALVHDDNKLIKAANIITFDDVGNLDTIEQTFNKMLNLLLRRYGNPTFFYERGQFTNQLRNDVNNDRFIRIFEWELPNGTLRFGIPRRLNREVRMEIHFGDDFPPFGDTLWGINEVF